MTSTTAISPSDLDGTDAEDFFSTFIQTLEPHPLIHSPGIVSYGNVAVEAAPKEGKAISLLADAFFSPGLVLAEMVEMGQVDVAGKHILELGSGAGLPSLIAASMIPAPASVLLTDYPDPAVTSNLAANVQRNLAAAGGRCMLAWKGYAWGEVVRELLSTLNDPDHRFDIVFLADLLWMTQTLSVLLDSVYRTLSHASGSRAYILCGDYTPSANISRFLSEAEALGFTTGPLPISSAWEGSLLVKGLAGPEVESREDGWKETLTARKKRVTGFWLGWKVECRRQDE